MGWIENRLTGVKRFTQDYTARKALHCLLGMFAVFPKVRLLLGGGVAVPCDLGTVAHVFLN